MPFEITKLDYTVNCRVETEHRLPRHLCYKTAAYIAIISIMLVSRAKTNHSNILLFI